MNRVADKARLKLPAVALLAAFGLTGCLGATGGVADQALQTITQLDTAGAGDVLLDSATQNQQDALEIMNRDRIAHGVNPLPSHPDLVARAQAWAERLAAEDTIYHSELNVGLNHLDWATLGENVGMGPNAERIEEGYMNSPAHRDNMLNPVFTSAGIGVAHQPGGKTFTVQIFMLEN